MPRVLVTGGSGFIGQHLVSELVARGRQVRVLDIRAPSRTLPVVEYIEGSVLDTRLVHDATAGVDEVYHLAGLPGMWKLDRIGIPRRQFHRYPERSDRRAPSWCSTVPALLNRVHSLQRLQPDALFREEALLSVDDMPGPYTRSKMLADEFALQAAASGFPVIVGCPTMPIGPYDHSVTPPTAMLQYFLRTGIFQFYLDFIVNMVDVRDVAAGLVLAMEKGRVGHRYVLGGDSLPLRQILALMASISGRRKVLVPLPGPLAELAASIMELTADYVTCRQPSATVEGVRIARRAVALSSEKARRELGYVPRPVEPLLQEIIAHMVSASAGEVLKHG